MPQYQGKGRPRKHGDKMKLSDPETWAVPVEVIEIDDPTWGVIEISRWSRFHFSQSADYPMEIILIQHQGKKLSQRAATPMWLAWIGEEELSSSDLWKLYLRRFAPIALGPFYETKITLDFTQIGNNREGTKME